MRGRAAVVLLALSLLMAAFVAVCIGGVLAGSTPGIRNLPLAVANLDRGATVHGKHINLGARVVDALRGNPALRGVVGWTVFRSRAPLIGGMNDDTYYAGLVIPANYSARLSALLDPRTVRRAPATLQILTSPAAGLAASSASTGILLTAAGAASRAFTAQEIGVLSRAHVRLSPREAAAVGDPVQITQTVVEPTPDHTARGGAALYFTLVVLLSAILGTTMLSQGIDMASRAAAAGGKPPSSLATWRRKSSIAVVFCVLAGIILTLVVGAIYGVPVSTGYVFLLYTMLCLLTIATLTLFWSTLAGPRGIVLTILFAIAVGVPTSGAVTPPEMLPAVYQWLHSWVPLRFVVDGYRALILFHGRGDAGLSRATAALAIETVLLASLAIALAAIRDRRYSTSRQGVEDLMRAHQLR